MLPEAAPSARCAPLPLVAAIIAFTLCLASFQRASLASSAAFLFGPLQLAGSFPPVASGGGAINSFPDTTGPGVAAAMAAAVRSHGRVDEAAAEHILRTFLAAHGLA